MVRRLRSRNYDTTKQEHFMRVVKGILCILAAALFGGFMLSDTIVAILLCFNEFSLSLIGWGWGIAGIICGGITGVLFFRFAD
jgi:hypothetical protein